MPVSDQTPNVIIIDSSENPMEVSGGQPVPNGTKGLLAVGIQSNGTASYLSLDSAGFLRITGSVSQTGAYTVTGSVTVSNTVAITGSVGLTNFPVTQSITGSVGISGVPTVTGSVTVANQINVTGSIAVTNVPAVTGSVSVLNTVTITARTLAGSGTLAPFTGSLVGGKDASGNFQPLAVTTGGFLFVSGNVSASIVGTPTVTGSVTVPNTVTVTGSVGVTNFPATQSVTGTVGISGTPTVTGSVSVLNAVTVTGSVATTIVNPTLAGTGSLSPTTGSLVGGKDISGNFQPFAVTTGGVQFISGAVSASIVGTPTVTGSITVPNTVAVTGSVGISGTPTITGSISVLNTVNVAFADPAEGITGSIPPSRAIFIGGYDAGSVVMRALSVDTTGKLNVNATAAGSPNVGGTGSAAPTSASLGGAVDGSGILRPFLSDNSGRQIVQMFNTGSITGSVGVNGLTFASGALAVFISGTSVTDAYQSGSVGSLNAAVTIALSGNTGCGFHLVSSSLSGAITPEISFDNGQTWVATGFFNVDTKGLSDTLAFTSASIANQSFAIMAPAGADLARIRVSNYVSGLANIRLNASLMHPQVQYVSMLDGRRSTYSATNNPIASAALATDIAILFGSPTKIIRLTRLQVYMTRTTAGAGNISLIKRTSRNTAGTQLAMSKVRYDSRAATSTATAAYYSANPTVGTQEGVIRIYRGIIPAAATLINNPIIDWEWGNGSSSALILNNEFEGFAVNLDGVTFTGGTFSVCFEWTEE